jgi:hypothetical protein
MKFPWLTFCSPLRAREAPPWGGELHKDLTFLKIRGLLKTFFVLLKHGHLAQHVMSFTPLETPLLPRCEAALISGLAVGMKVIPL